MLERVAYTIYPSYRRFIGVLTWVLTCGTLRLDMAIVVFSTLFVVLGDPANVKLTQALAEKFPGDHILIRPGQWFVVSSGTAVEVSDKLEVTPGNATGTAVIAGVSGYYGRANNQIWEWIVAKVGKPSNA